MQALDIERLRAAAVSPRGLGTAEERRQLWYALLGVEFPPEDAACTSHARHDRNRQRALSPDTTVTSPTATSRSDESRLSLHDPRSSIPAIQFGSFAVGSDSASSTYTESLGEPESTLGSESVTTESQHAVPTSSDQLKPPAFSHASNGSTAGAAGDEWQTVSKRRRAGSRSTSQLGHGDEPEASALLPLGTDPRNQASGVASSSASSPAPPPGLSSARSINRFDALRAAQADRSSSSPSPTRARKQSRPAKRSRAGSLAPSLQASESKSDIQDAGVREESAQGKHVAQSGASQAAGSKQTVQRPVDRIAELLDSAEGLSPRDTQQVELDVNRSFLNFRKGSLKNSTVLAARRRQLSTLCIGVLRRRKALSYYQGYHDVLTVLLLTLLPETKQPDSIIAIPSIPPHLHLAAERLSLHWLRDAMTRNLDAVMGHLRLLRDVLRDVDSDMADLVERAFPLPYFALPWLITLLTHSLPNLALAQRVLDFVLVYGPMSTLYLCATIIRLNKEAVASIASSTSNPDDVDTEIQIHQALATLPAFRLDDEAATLVEDSDDDDADVNAQQGEGDDQFADAVGDDSLYDDPDVFGPADAASGDLGSPQPNGSATSGAATPSGSTKKGRSAAAVNPHALPISQLLRQAADLMAHHATQLEAASSQIMGPGSVLATWPATIANRRAQGLQDRQHSNSDADAAWDAADERAEYIIRVDSGDVQPDGPEPADNLIIVHPELPADAGPFDGGEGIGEKFPTSSDEKGDGSRSRRTRVRTRTTSVRASHKADPASLAAKTTTVTIAALGVAGVLLGMYAASNSGAGVGGFVAASAGDRAEQAREALGLVARWLSLMH